MQPRNAKQNPSFMASALHTCLTDYLVICGRAPACSMDPACATLESPLDSIKHIIARLRCTAQHSLMQGSSYWHLLSPMWVRALTHDNINLRNAAYRIECSLF